MPELTWPQQIAKEMQEWMTINSMSIDDVLSKSCILELEDIEAY